jgi:hypothetical protein
VAGSRREYLAADKLELYITVKLSSVTDADRGSDLDDRPKFNITSFTRTMQRASGQSISTIE